MADSPADRPYAPKTDPGLLEAIRIDLNTIHEAWMVLAFPKVRTGAHAVLGAWRPDSALSLAAYYLWSALGALVVGAVYPLAVVGFAVRYYAVKLDRTATRVGILGVVLLSILVWGGLTVFARYRFSTEGFLAVAAAGGVATVSAALSVLFARVGGRFTTVLFAYPFGMTALFLPPVVAALYSPSLATVVFPSSDLLAVWILDNVLDVRGINVYLRSRFDLVGVTYVGMWFGLAVPVGWVLGLLVTLADLVRPTRTSDGE
ncbi:MAG: hypothetical protein U5J98_12680 [Halobacteriales archaeon]|nr:hypothetical protein [Halobacteriales archaeon]